MRDLLIKDLGWKLFSLFLALAIWLTVHKINEESDAAPVSVVGSTITFEGLPVVMVASMSDVHDFRVVPRTVTVTVSGPPDLMASLQASQVRAMINLTDTTNLAKVKDLSRLVEVSAPSGVTLISVDPPKVGIILPPGH